MKSILVILSLAFASLAQAKDVPQKIDMLKCGSMEQGSIWAVFGHRYTGGVKEVGHFPSEIIYISPSGDIQRLNYRNSKEANALTSTRYMPGMAFTLSVTLPNEKKTIEIVMAPFDARDLLAMKGTWTTSLDGAPGKSDATARCLLR